jgi:hypothetical protein
MGAAPGGQPGDATLCIAWEGRDRRGLGGRVREEGSGPAGSVQLNRARRLPGTQRNPNTDGTGKPGRSGGFRYIRLVEFRAGGGPENERHLKSPGSSPPKGL